MTKKRQTKKAPQAWPGPMPDGIQTIQDVGVHMLYSTILLSEVEWAKDSSRPRVSRWFGYSIGGQLPGAVRPTTALRLETNLNCAHMLVDECFSITHVELAVPRVALSDYQINPDAGPYEVTASDMASLMASAHVGFFSGGDKPFAEAVLADLPTISVDDLSDKLPEFACGGVGGWIMRLPNQEDNPLEIRRIEKFWGELDCGMRSAPIFGRHAYNPAVIPMAMILTGKRVRRTA